MRFAANDGLRNLRRGLAAVALLALSASGASAQLLFDGNLVFNNNASGTLGGQFLGSAGAGAPTCPAGLTAATLFGTTYPHNIYADPLLSGAIYQANVAPNWQPGLGSPAYSNAVEVINDGFFKQVCLQGAIGPNPGDDWTQGWTFYDSTGAGRQDLHLAGMPDPRPLATYDNINLYQDQYWGPDSNYLVRGQLRVKSQARLTVAPGVVIFEDNATVGTIIVERGGKLFAVGSICDPIIITSSEPPGSQAIGQCGGIVINGRAKTNVVNSCAGDSAASEGATAGFYGGNDDTDDSGALRYVRIEFAGRERSANNELNAFTWNSVGSRTRANYLQAHRGADDAFEWFGGNTTATHLVATDGTDDGIDSQLGSRVKIQFAVVRTNPRQAPALTQFGERGIEADNNEFNNSETQCSGISYVRLANVTMVGDKRAGAAFPGSTQGAEWRRGTAYDMRNSIIFNYKSAAVRVSDDATWEFHCQNPPAVPAAFCPGAVSVAPISQGRVFVASSRPNPFRNEVTLSFTLPQSGPVSVDIYSADGRRVQTLAKGDMTAGQHQLSWKLDRDTPSGVYFYQVVAGGDYATGKLVAVD
jgi:hypothetical protein